MNGIGWEFWVKVLILEIKDSREPEKTVASVRSVQDVTDRPRNEVIVVVVVVVVEPALVTTKNII